MSFWPRSRELSDVVQIVRPLGASGTRSGGLRKGQSPCELLGGLSGFLSVDAGA